MNETIQLKFVNKHSLQSAGLVKTLIILGIAVVMIASSACQPERQRADYNVPVAQLEQTFGRLVTVSNMPTPDQNGTGDRMGLFRDESGTLWGIPLTSAENGSVAGCAPPALREVAVSDRLPAGTTEIVGAANEPNGWRGGTGKLELLLRDAQGGLRWHSVEAVAIQSDPMCWSQSPPVQPLKHYRIVIANAGN